MTSASPRLVVAFAIHSRLKKIEKDGNGWGVAGTDRWARLRREIRMNPYLIFEISLVVGAWSPNAGSDVRIDMGGVFSAAVSVGGGSACPKSGCGTNSPFFGHELELPLVHGDGGEPNDEGVSIIGFDHARRPGSVVDVQVIDDRIVARDSSGELSNTDLVGLIIELEWQQSNEVFEIDANADVPRPTSVSVMLLGVFERSMWAQPLDHGDRLTPAYKFSYWIEEGLPQPLCPQNVEGDSFDPLAVSRIREETNLIVAGADPQVVVNEHVAVVYLGDRWSTDDFLLTPNDSGRWISWGCEGHAADKLHRMGFTDAGNRRLGRPGVGLEQRQAALFAIMAKYCPDAPPLTVPGHALRYADYRNVLDRSSTYSFEPSSPGFFEALWDLNGAICIDVPRLAEEDELIFEKIAGYCPALLETPCNATTDTLRGDSLSAAVPLMTFTPI